MVKANQIDQNSIAAVTVLGKNLELEFELNDGGVEIKIPADLTSSVEDTAYVLKIIKK